MRSAPHISCLLFAALLMVGSANAEDATFQPFFSTETFLYSEPVTLETTKNNWQGTYQPNGTKQIGTFRIEAGVTNNDWTIAALYRENYQLDFSSDTADFYYSIENNLPLDSQRNYQLDLNAYRFRGKGISVRKNFKPHPTVQANIGISLFQASDLLDGNMTGQVNATANDSYNFALDIDMQYAEDPLFERRLNDMPSGKGLALDAEIQWQATDQLKVDIKAHDIAGLVRWENVPFTTAVANSNNITTNEQGFTQVNPLLSGREGYHGHFTQNLKPSAEAALTYQFEKTPYFGQARVRYFDGTSWLGLGLLKQQNDSWGWGLNFWPQNKIAEVSLSKNAVDFSLGVDAFDFDEISTLWLSLSYND